MARSLAAREVRGGAGVAGGEGADLAQCQLRCEQAALRCQEGVRRAAPRALHSQRGRGRAGGETSVKPSPERGGETSIKPRAGVG
jgi:hypothetical protein